MRAALTIMCTALIVVSAYAQSPPSDTFLIVPGVRLGMLRLGMTLQEADDALGVSGEEPDGHVYVWHPRQPGGPLIAVVNARGRIVEVKTYWDTAYETSGGLHIGLSDDDVRLALGAPLAVRQWSHFEALYYRGIVFTVDRDSTVVTGIGVIPPPGTMARDGRATGFPGVALGNGARCSSVAPMNVADCSRVIYASPGESASCDDLVQNTITVLLGA